MNERDIAEIRRRMRPEKNNIGRIRGCYVNDNHVIISEFNHNFSLISTDESEEILSTLRKIFTGTLGRNIINLSFTNQQVTDGEHHKLLTQLRESSLSDDSAVKSFFEKTVSSLEISGSYLILLANDKYDIFTYDENGEQNESSEMFSYFLCAICPIKTSKPSLGYNLSENKFKNIIKDSLICAPSIGFMFPAFENRGANIYETLYYTRDVSELYEKFAEAIFNTYLPLPASVQTENVAAILNNSVSEDCNLELIQSVQSQLIELANDHKTNKVDDPLMLSAKDMESILRCGGINEDKVNDFSQKIKDNLGDKTVLPPANIIDIKKFEVKTPDVTVKVKPENSELIQTKIIDGTKYILIRADGDIEVNGIKINISE